MLKNKIAGLEAANKALQQTLEDKTAKLKERIKDLEKKCDKACNDLTVNQADVIGENVQLKAELEKTKGELDVI